MTVVVRTHGGLGNQLFQLLFARLLAAAQKTDYAELHDDRYAHKFARSAELRPPPATASRMQRFVSGMRLPKLLTRSRLAATEQLSLLGHSFLDGYFQQARDYQSFADSAIRLQVDAMRAELRIQAQRTPDGRTLYHMRLGDFFNNAQEALDHLVARIQELRPDSTIITNQEELFADARVQAQMRASQCQLLSTQAHSPEDVLRLMSTHGRIVTNNSTLALWASVFGNCATEFSLPRLAEVHARLFNAANPSPAVG